MRRATDNPNHYAMVGHSESLTGSNQRVFVMRTNGAGNPLWAYSYGDAPGRQFSQKLQIQNCESGGYIVCGTVVDGLVGRSGFLLRIDDAGNMLWMRFYPQPGVGFNLNAFQDVQETPEGFVVTGYAPTQVPSGPAQNSSDTIILTTDALGTPIWAKQYANIDGNNGGESITVLPQGYAVVGGHLPTLLDAYTTELFTVDSSGALSWYNRIFGFMDGGSHFQNQQISNGMLRDLPNGDLIFVGGDFTDAGLLRFDASGAYVSGQTYGQIYGQHGTSYVIEPSGQFTVVGPSSTGLNLEYYVIRADANFVSGCNEAPTAPPIDTPPIEVVDIVFSPVNVDGTFPLNPISTPVVWAETVLCQANSCLDPFTATCTLASGDVTVDWAPVPPMVASIEIRRGGTLMAVLPGTATNWTDTSPPFGTSIYEVTLVPIDPTCDRASESCSQFVGFIVIDVISDVIFRPARPIVDTPIVCWADDLETLGRTPRVISDFSEISPQLGSGLPDQTPIVWLSLGEFPEQHELTDTEGQILVEFLAGGGSLYIEGADVAFGPPTPLSAIDGVTALDDGGNAAQVASLTGLDSGLGLDASGLSSDYTGSSRSIDHLSPDGSGSAAIFQNAGGEGQITGVYHDASLDGQGSHRVVTSSTALAGYAGDRSALLGAYLDALSPPSAPDPQFIRGECNGDGVFDLADGIFTLSFLFAAGSTGPCAAACDGNGDGSVDLGDAIFAFSYLLLGGSPPPAPFPDCGVDVAGSSLDCLNSPSCP